MISSLKLRIDTPSDPIKQPEEFRAGGFQCSSTTRGRIVYCYFQVSFASQIGVRINECLLILPVTHTDTRFRIGVAPLRALYLIYVGAGDDPDDI